MRETEKRTKAAFLTILFIGYLIFNGILLWGHELWRDEANVWLLARELSPFELLGEIKYQGHPCLWYLLAMPFAKLGFPFKTLSVLSFLVMSAAAGIFVYRGPFSPVSKAAALFSPVFSYFYSVVARNYCLIALLMILLAYYYKKRWEKPLLYGLLLGLLVQADSIAIAPAGLISAMWLWEGVSGSLRGRQRRPFWAAVSGLWIVLLSVLFWGLQFFQVSESPEYHFRMLPLPELLTEIRNFTYVILTRLTGCGKRADQLLLLLFLAAAVLAGIRLRSAWPGLVMAGAFLFEILFSIMVYQLHIWHYIALCFVLLWFVWVSFMDRGEAKAGKRDKVTMAGYLVSETLLVLLCVLMFTSWNSEKESSNLENALCGVYSDGKNTADYIREKIETKELLVCVNVSQASTVQAYLGPEYEFYFAGTLRPETYADYREEQSQEIAYEQLLVWVRTNYPEKEAFYLLESSGSCLVDVTQADRNSWEPCYETGVETARGESYQIYRIAL